MSANPPATRRPDDELGEHGLQIATRLVAVVRTGRSYTIGNQVFTAQLEQLLEVVRTALQAHGEAQIVALDGDLHLNGVRLPLRPSSLKFTDQLVQELDLRAISGLQFLPGLELQELEAFMRLFLPSDVHRGDELARACSAQGITHALPVVQAVAAPTETAAAEAEAPPAWRNAMEAYDRALHNARLLMGGGAPAHGVELRHLKRVAQPLVDGALSGDATTSALADVGHAQAWAHAVHVCLVSVSIGRQLGLDRRTLADLGVAALLHDVGQASVAGSLGAPQGTWNAADRDLAQRHTLEGMKLLAHSGTLNATTLAAMRAALEHHAVPGEAGYPRLGVSWKPAALSEIVGISDAFVCLLAHHGERAAHLTPYDVLGLVLGPLAGQFHPALRAALVRAVGVYPPGQIIELEDGSIARVLATLSERPGLPIVERLTLPTAPHDRARIGEVLSRPDECAVRRALPREEWPAPAGEARAA